MTHINQERLREAMVQFETGDDLSPSNPFDIANAMTTTRLADPFLTGGAIPDTARYLSNPDQDSLHAGAVAGFLQGLAIGYEYCEGDHGD